MKKLFHIILVGGFLLATIGGVPAPAQTTSVGFRITGATVTEKDTFTVTIFADTLLTGRNIFSFRFVIDYSPYYLEYVGTGGPDTVLNLWGMPSLNSSNAGSIILAGAGSTPLSGSGPMITLKFVALRPGGSYISFNSSGSYLNERNPPSVFTNGYVSIVALPRPDIYPDQQILFVGQQVKMGVYGGTAPYVFSVLDPAVAAITSGDSVRGVGPGTTRIQVTDANGEVSATTGYFDVRAVRLNLDEASVWPADTFYLPLHIEVAPGITVFSGQLELLHDNTLTGLTGDIRFGDFQLVMENNDNNGKMMISFASTVGITGSGVLCYVGFRANNPGSRWMSFGNVHFNESLSAISVKPTYYINVNSLPTLVLSPNYGTYMWGSNVKINVSNGTPPYTFTVSDTSIAGTDALGNLSMRSGGRVTVTAKDVHGATGTTGTFTILDHKVYIDTTDGIPDQDTRVPLLTTPLPAGKNILGYELTITYDTSYLDFIRMDPAGSNMLTQSVREGNLVRIAGASSSGISSGLLGFMVFRIRNIMPLLAVTPVTILSFSANENRLLNTLSNGVVRRVAQVSYRPVAKAGNDFSVTEGGEGRLDGTGSYDYDGDPLNYLWHAPLGIILDDSTAAQPLFTAPWVTKNTIFTFTLVVSDGINFSDPDPVNVTVLQVNHAPIASAGADMNYAEGSSVSLDGSGSYDPDGDAISYLWTSLDGIILFNKTGVSPTLILPQVTENTSYRFTLKVSDGLLSSTVDTVVLTSIQVNKKPVAFAGGDFSVNETDTATLDGSLSYDADNDPLTFRWTAPAGITLTSDTVPNPAFTAPAVHRDSIITFTLVVNDGFNDSDPDEVQVTIINLDSLSRDAYIDSVFMNGLDSFAIDTSLSLVTLYMPYGYDIRTIAPDFKLSRYATISPSGGSIHDFSTPVYYTVTAEDNITQRLWKVMVYTPAATVQRQLQSGWNWVSLNVRPADRSISTLFSALTLTNTDHVKSADYSSTWYTQTGWFGDLQVFPENRMIKFRKAVAEPFTAVGGVINPTLESISLIPGWNDLGYLLRSDAAIDAAITPSTIPAGDVLLKGETGSAVYYNGSGWSGEISTLQVLHGYRLYVTGNGNLKYNPAAAPAKSKTDKVYSRQQLLEDFRLIPQQFEYSSTLIAEAVTPGGVNLTQKGDLLAAYDGECRGVTEAVFIPDLNRYIFILTLFGNQAEEQISLQMITYGDKKTYDTHLTIPFHPDEIIGKPTEPLQLTMDNVTGVEKHPGSNTLYTFPNPVTDRLSLSSSSLIKEITIYHITGKEVFHQNCQSEAVTVSMEGFAPGIYTIRIITEDRLFIRKVVKSTY